MRSFIFTAVMIGLAVSAFADRSPFDGLTPKGLEPGSPAGSYALSGLDTVNLYNRSLSVAIPLLQIGGRGEAAYTVTAPLDHLWSIVGTVQTFSDGNCGNPPCNVWHPVYGAYVDFNERYRPAGILARKTGDGSQPPSAGNTTCGGTSFYTHTLTRLTVRFADGTEMELRDTAPLLSGKYASPDITATCGANPFAGAVNRGTTWVAVDGSATTFVAAHPVMDNSYADGSEGSVDHPGGILYFRDGRQFHFRDGLYDNSIDWMKDRNGNLITFGSFTPTAPVGTTGCSEGLSIQDPLYRETRVSIGCTLTDGTGYKDVITYAGANNQARTIQVFWRFNYLDIATAQPSCPNYTCLFGYGDNQPITGHAISQITMPDGKSYAFQYTAFGEPARITLPTGAKYEYDWENSLGGSSTTAADSNSLLNVALLRRVLERREYANGSTMSRRTVYSNVTPGTTENPLSGIPCGCTKVHVDDWDMTVSAVAAVREHYYYGDPTALATLFPLLNTYSPWFEGREFRTDILNGSGGMLRKKIDTWQQRMTPAWWGSSYGFEPVLDARVIQTDETIDGGKVSRRATSFSTTSSDNSNNPINIDEYDYGAGAPGALLRRTHTDYYFNANYNPVPAHLRSLPFLVQVFAGTNLTTPVAQTRYTYDQTSPTGLSGLINYADPGASTGRGNVTLLERWRNTDGVWLGTLGIYDIAGNVTSVKSPLTPPTTFNFTNNCAGQGLAGTYALVSSITKPLGQTVTYGWDCNIGKPTSITDVAGAQTTADYSDVLDRLTLITRKQVDSGYQPLSQADSKTAFAYAADLLSVTTAQDQNGTGDGLLVNKAATDKLGRTTDSIVYTPSGQLTTTKAYDGFGRAKTVSNPGASGEVTTTVYDFLGRVTSSAYPDTSIESFAYAGNATLHKDPAGTLRWQETDALGRLTRVVEAPAVAFPTDTASYAAFAAWTPTTCSDTTATATANLCTKYEYDTLDNLTKVTQGAQVRDFRYDSLSQLIAARNPEVAQTVTGTTNCPGASSESWSTCYSYDSNGNLSTQVSPGASSGTLTTTFTYDQLDRLQAKTYSDGSPVVSCPGLSGTFSTCYTYDTVKPGCLTSVANSVSSTTFTYGPGCQVRTSTQTTGGTAYGFDYGYNLAGALTAEKYPSGRVVRMSYDTAGRPTAVCNGVCTGTDKYASGFGYAQYGLPTGMTLGNAGNNVVETRSYNSRLQVTNITAGSWSMANNYGTSSNNGNVLSQTISGVTRSYTYDALNRLLSTSQGEGYSYDRYGNRAVATRSSPLPGLTGETATLLSQYTASNNRMGSFGYDQRGNVTAVPGRPTTTYDAENHQKTSVNVNGTSSYNYDGDGRRVSKTVGTVTTTFVYDAMGQLAAEYGGTPTPVGRQYVTVDHLGSTRLVTDQSGAATKTYDYLPFGEELNVACLNSADGVKFGGYRRDQESCLDFAETRYMSSTQGRFTSPDSYNIVQEMLKGKDADEQRQILNDYLSNPQEWNKYTYALNNPLKNIDPDGRNACETDDDSTCKVTVTFQDRTKDKQGKYNDQFTGEKNQQNYNATATITVTNSVTGKTTTAGVFLAKTTPSDDGTHFATIQSGTYSAILGTHNGNPALRLNNGGAIPVVGGIDPATGAKFADGILVHLSGLNNFTGTFRRPNGKLGGVSEGCQLICRSEYGEFLHATGIKPDAGTPQRHFTVTVNTRENRP